MEKHLATTNHKEFSERKEDISKVTTLVGANPPLPELEMKQFRRYEIETKTSLATSAEEIGIKLSQIRLCVTYFNSISCGTTSFTSSCHYLFA